MEAIGSRSKELLNLLEQLEAKHAQVAEEETRLAQEVTDRQTKLNVARAQGLVGKVARDQVTAFESELAKLQSKLSETRSTLAGFDQMLAEKRRALEEAKVADAREALMTEEMDAVQKGLAVNTQALEKTRAAFLGTLEADAIALLERIAPHRERWEELVEERKQLYTQRKKALGPGANQNEDPYYRLQRDRLVTHPFGDFNDIPQVVALAELLKPLLPTK